ncbi:DnaE-like DNA polymerase III alpha [Gordonia phage Commandaria]|uniref:DnaE-like DNA polymerase III alpha n=1 Tax=Gordonia phage Commandaria TaxID=3038364 RepID=A0AAF0K1Y2_9CAUD|nr:DnaE-like DNA polymerase III alpha [Gordonia phage Commandaria]WGH20844.1 DnaE-like DNA polymerase III alpha [Gordonia phage Commandaria]
MEWVSLHTHSSFSHGDGYRKPAEHVARVKELGMNALALTEHRNLSSHVQLEQAAHAAGIKPIYGVEFDIAPADEPRRRHFHQTVLAMNAEGYRNLNRLVTLAWEQTKYVPRLHLNQILDPELTAGLIVTSGCADSWISCTLLGGKSLGDRRDDWTKESVDETRALIAKFQKCYGDRFYLEMQMFPELDRAVLLNQFFGDVANADGIPTVATADVHYPYPEQNEIQRMLHAAHRGGTVATQDADWEYDVRLTYPTSDAECQQKLMACELSHREANASIRGAREIADRCNVELPKSERVVYVTRGKQMSASDRLKKWINEGIEFRADTDLRFAQRWDIDTDAYLERIQYEFSIIEPKGFCDYFLVCSDLVKWAKDVAKMGVGPGRGSAAGSLLCYLLRITEIDPMQFPLMQFERFIDPSRPDDPDIDIDFADPSRVFAYARQKYGEEKTAHIANYMRYRGRTAVADVARAYELSDFAEVFELKDLIVDRDDGDPRENFSVVDAIAGFERAREIIDKYPDLRMAAKIEGDYRGLGIHAAGLVISTNPINETCAVYTQTKDGVTRRGIAYDKRDAEYLGMLKLDILGLKTMAMIDDVLDWIGMSHNDLYALPLDNEAVFRDVFGTGDLTGIFQFDGRTTRGIVNTLSAGTQFEFRHLADINALSRPGALISGQTKHYEAVELGREEPRDWGYPEINRVLAPTNGCLVYQEQVMGMGRVAGMPGERVGALRRIIGKKKQGGAFEAFWEEFRDGMKAEIGMPEGDARELWDYMAASSSYLFNIAHAVCYSVVGYWLAWLKRYYPTEFFAAALRYADKDQTLALLKDAVRHDIAILEPSLAKSGLTWEPVTPAVFKGLREDGSPKRGFVTPSSHSIRAGFTQIDGIAAKVGAKMVEWRDARATPNNEGPVDFALLDLDWDDMRYVAAKKGRKTKPDEPSRGVPGLGAKTIARIREMASSRDPFGINKAARAVQTVEDAINDGEIGLLGDNTPSDLLLHAADDRVVFIGLIREVKIKDHFEALRKRTGRPVEELRAEDKAPEKSTKATIIAEDGEGIEVHIYVHRFLYPDLASELAEVGQNTAVHVLGISREGHGPSVQAEEVTLIELEE